MPRGPKGEKRPADVIGAAVMVAKIATGEAEETPPKEDSAAVQFARSGGLKGGQARAKALTAQRRRAIAREAAKIRWGKRGREGSKS
jgi:hypothetical protein